jgi:hypothetical protein
VLVIAMGKTTETMVMTKCGNLSTNKIWPTMCTMTSKIDMEETNRKKQELLDRKDSSAAQSTRKKKSMNMAVLQKAHTLSRTVQPTLVNGSKECVTDTEPNFGPMALVMRECGEVIKQMVKESLCMLTETYTKANG